jgi:hypothetical protein
MLPLLIEAADAWHAMAAPKNKTTATHFHGKEPETHTLMKAGVGVHSLALQVPPEKNMKPAPPQDVVQPWHTLQT